jgi:hypothetical protein
MNKDAGTVISIRVKKSSASGSVARDFSLVRAYPTNPDEAINKEVQVTSKAWLNERRKTLRFISDFSVCIVRVAKLLINGSGNSGYGIICSQSAPNSL